MEKKDKDKGRGNETENHVGSQRDSVFRPPVARGLNTSP